MKLTLALASSRPITSRAQLMVRVTFMMFGPVWRPDNSRRQTPAWGGRAGTRCYSSCCQAADAALYELSQQSWLQHTHAHTQYTGHMPLSPLSPVKKQCRNLKRETCESSCFTCVTVIQLQLSVSELLTANSANINGASLPGIDLNVHYRITDYSLSFICVGQ